jgi:predicted nucleic acid-binding protein
VRQFIQELIAGGGAAIFPPAASLAPRCLQIAEQLGIRGARIFDVLISLCALEAGASELWTHDAGFIAFPGLKVLDPLQRA